MANGEKWTIQYGNSTKSHSCCTTNIGSIELIVDPSVSSPLLSVIDINKSGKTVVFADKHSYIVDNESGEEFPLTWSEDHRLWTFPIKTLMKLETGKTASCNAIKTKRSGSNVTQKEKEKVLTLHRIMGHASTQNMCTAVENGLWQNTGLDSKAIRRTMHENTCIVCIMAKRQRINFPKANEKHHFLPGEIVSVDPLPVPTTAFNGAKWIFLFKDIGTGFWLAPTGKEKSEYPIHLLNVIEFYLENDCAIKIIRSDDEIVLRSDEVMEIFREHRIKRQSSVPYQHQQNSVERDVQTLSTSMAALMHDQHFLKADMWPFALDWIVDTHNRTPNSNTPRDTPMHIIANSTLNFENSFSFCFGDIVGVGTSKEHRLWKFDTRRDLGVYVGQPDGYVHGHLIYFPHDGSVKVRADVIKITASDEDIAKFYSIKSDFRKPQSSFQSLTKYVDWMKANPNDRPLEVEEIENNQDPPAVEILDNDQNPQEGDNLEPQDLQPDNLMPQDLQHDIDENVAMDLDVMEPEIENVNDMEEMLIIENEEDDVELFDDNVVEVYVVKVRTANNPTVKRAMEQPDHAEWSLAIHSEVHTNLLATGTLLPVDRPSGSVKITFLTVQLKRKFFPDGTVDKYKARGCFRGDLMEKGYTETFSPTISDITLSLIQNIAVIDGMEQCVVDTVGAYLEQDYPPTAKVLYVKLDKLTAEISGLDPNQVYQIKRYLYGICDSGRAYFIAYSNLLKSNNYLQSEYDSCLFFRRIGDDVIYICTHVDDTLVYASNNRLLNEFCVVVQQIYSITVKDEAESYVGIHYEKLRDGSVRKTQPKLLEDLFEKYDIQSKPSVKTPASVPSIADDHDIPIPVTQYLSLLGSLLYVVRSRPDIGFAVSFSATKSKAPTEHDWKGLLRILQYLHETRDKGQLIMKQDSHCDLHMHIYVDASYLLYPDSKSQTGYSFSINDVGFFYSKSSKQAIVTTSSTHSEARGIFTAVCDYVFMSYIAEEIGRPFAKPAIVHEDNMPIIALLTKEQSIPRASKHFLKLVNYVKERILGGEITMKHIPTNLNVPDVLTKHIFGQDFKYKAQQLLGVAVDEIVELPMPSKKDRNPAN